MLWEHGHGDKRFEVINLSDWFHSLSSTIPGVLQCACIPPQSWYLLIQDPVSISILITRISNAVSICIFLARVWHILAVILIVEAAQSHVLSIYLSHVKKYFWPQDWVWLPGLVSGCFVCFIWDVATSKFWLWKSIGYFFHACSPYLLAIPGRTWQFFIGVTVNVYILSTDIAVTSPTNTTLQRESLLEAWENSPQEGRWPTWSLPLCDHSPGGGSRSLTSWVDAM